MKSKIAAMENLGYKLYIRIKQDPSSQKNYNKFKQEIIDKFKVEVKGHMGFTDFRGKNIDINVFKDGKYIHLVFYLKNKMKNKILDILMHYFKFMNPI